MRNWARLLWDQWVQVKVLEMLLEAWEVVWNNNQMKKINLLIKFRNQMVSLVMNIYLKTSKWIIALTKMKDNNILIWAGSLKMPPCSKDLMETQMKINKSSNKTHLHQKNNQNNKKLNLRNLQI